MEPIRRLTLWVAAFVPAEIPGVTRAAPSAGGERRTLYEAAEGWRLTDQRAFDPSPAAPARFRAMLEIDLPAALADDATPPMRTESRADPATAVDPTDGRVTDRRTATPEVRWLVCRGREDAVSAALTGPRHNPAGRPVGGRSLIPAGAAVHGAVDAVGRVRSTDRPWSAVELRLAADVPDPFAPSASPIVLRGVFTVRPAEREIAFEGLATPFPAMECHASADGGPPVPVFRAGVEHARLPGAPRLGADRRIASVARL